MTRAFRISDHPAARAAQDRAGSIGIALYEGAVPTDAALDPGSITGRLLADYRELQTALDLLRQADAMLDRELAGVTDITESARIIVRGRNALARYGDRALVAEVLADLDRDIDLCQERLRSLLLTRLWAGELTAGEAEAIIETLGLPRRPPL